MKVHDKLRSFLILEELGHGGMGGVYIGYDFNTHQLVAVKTLFQEFANDEAYIKRFQREANVYRGLNHANIVHYVDSGIEAGTHYIALEFVAGKPLDAILKNGGAMPPKKALEVFECLVDAIRHAHEKSVIHRDLKPQNVVISHDGVVKLLDFGVAQADDDILKTVTGSILGTFFYSSPEQNQGKKIDARSDLYSLGLVFYEMLTGKRALVGNDLLQVTMAQMKSNFTPPSAINTAVPKSYDALCLKLMEKSPDKRFQNATDLLAEIRKLKLSPGSGSVEDSFDSEETAKLWVQAKEAFKAKDFDTSLKLTEEVARKMDSSPDVHCLLGKLYAAKEVTQKALEHFKKSIALSGGDSQYVLYYGISLFEMKMFDAARLEFKKILDKDPMNPYASRYMHLIRQALGEPAPARPAAAPGRPPAGPAKPGGRRPN
ncbi:MAG: protein kinase [Candidatus Wallbacteria bacterium]|nr:protein kinase [Candidatus Wallbacteria bacterium]